MFNLPFKHAKSKSIYAVIGILSTLGLTGCLHESEDNTLKITEFNTIVAVKSEDSQSGALTIISKNDNDEENVSNETGSQIPEEVTYTVSDAIDADKGDLIAITHENNVYMLGRSDMNYVTKYDLTAEEPFVWQYSVQDEGQTNESNPHDLVFVSKEKAYIIRYGSDKVWIVNPSAETEEDFKIGEIDLSAYSDDDGLPEMTDGMIVNGKLYVLMQRLVTWTPDPNVPAYVAVIDINTDSEIDTGKGNSGLKGIPLNVSNPNSMQYLSTNQTLYIDAAGKYFPTAEFIGGITSIDLNTYDVSMILDDGDEASHPYGQIYRLAILSSTRGYFVGYNAWQDNDLYSFNPSTGEVDPIPLLEQKDIAALSIDPIGDLWIGNATDHGVSIIDTVTNEFKETLIDTTLNPINIDFVILEEETN